VRREGSLDAPTRHALDWRSPEFNDPAKLEAELERVFDICHGCRRCFSLCNAFPTLFDLVDATAAGEVHAVDKRGFQQVVDHCYLCDMCFMTKCPYVPPHEWNVDFPHLMLRAKAVKFRQDGASIRDRVLSATDAVGKLASIPVVVQTVNAANRSTAGRALLEATLGVHRDAPVPEYHSDRLSDRNARRTAVAHKPLAAEGTKGKVALFGTCYGEYNLPALGEDLIAVFEHNRIPVTLVPDTRCCGMPKLELGDLEAVAALMAHNLPVLSSLVDGGFDLTSPIPSCTLMFKQELPLLFPDDPLVAKVRDAFYDPFEYLMLRHKAGLLSVDFKQALGKVAYHVPCHLRVQNLGLKTREALELVPGTELEVIERCSGHDGTYAVKQEFHAHSRKIAKPVVDRVAKAGPAHYTSDCPMAGEQIAAGLTERGRGPEHPLSLLRAAYGI
jgi:glycerol-3-phosphate dehydrogenase subunit C